MKAEEWNKKLKNWFSYFGVNYIYEITKDSLYKMTGINGIEGFFFDSNVNLNIIFGDRINIYDEPDGLCMITRTYFRYEDKIPSNSN